MFIGIGLGLIAQAVGGVVNYDSAADDLFARMSTPPSASRKGQINQLITALKTAGVWNKLDMLKVFAAADAQAALLDWRSATYDASVVSGPTFTADRGYAGDGAASYVNLAWAPSNGVNFLQDSACLFGWSRTAAQEANFWLGTGTANGAQLNPRSTLDAFAYRINQASSSAPANTDGSGLFAADRSGASAHQAYRNGAALGAAGSVASAARSAVVLNMGRVNSTFSARQCSAVGAGSSLSAIEHAALYSALNTYMVAVGAA